MSGSQTRLELRIDVLDKKDQRALALPTLTVPQFLDAILTEFSEIEYLGNVASDYQLEKASDGTPLDDSTPIGQQVGNGASLVLVERERPLPELTMRPSQDVYLREQTTGKVFKLCWQPAIVGRLAESQPYNELVAVDLNPYGTALRVSRRHLQITEDAGQFFVENLSKNPALLLRNQDKPAAITAAPLPLQPGDIIELDRADIMLKFIVRNGALAPNDASAPNGAPVPNDELAKA